MNADQKFPSHSTGAMREKLTSISYDQLPLVAIEAYSRVAEYGAKKYDTWNWAKGLPVRQIHGSLTRHATAYIQGEDYDPESGLLHTDHILWNAVALAFNQAYGICDDRRPIPDAIRAMMNGRATAEGERRQDEYFDKLVRTAPDPEVRKSYVDPKDADEYLANMKPMPDAGFEFEIDLGGDIEKQLADAMGIPEELLAGDQRDAFRDSVAKAEGPGASPLPNHVVETLDDIAGQIVADMLKAGSVEVVNQLLDMFVENPGKSFEDIWDDYIGYVNRQVEKFGLSSMSEENIAKGLYSMIKKVNDTGSVNNLKRPDLYPKATLIAGYLAGIYDEVLA